MGLSCLNVFKKQYEWLHVISDHYVISFREMTAKTICIPVSYYTVTCYNRNHFLCILCNGGKKQ